MISQNRFFDIKKNQGYFVISKNLFCDIKKIEFVISKNLCCDIQNRGFKVKRRLIVDVIKFAAMNLPAILNMFALIICRESQWKRNK